MEKKEVNLIKDTCKKFKLTYKELGEIIGYGEANLKNSVSKKQISKQLKRAIQLYLKTMELQKEIDNTKVFKQSLKDFLEK